MSMSKAQSVQCLSDKALLMEAYTASVELSQQWTKQPFFLDEQIENVYDLTQFDQLMRIPRHYVPPELLSDEPPRRVAPARKQRPAKTVDDTAKKEAKKMLEDEGNNWDEAWEDEEDLTDYDALRQEDLDQDSDRDGGSED